MVREVQIAVTGHVIAYDKSIAGVQHEANATVLRIEFSEDWDGFAKKVVFWDAFGENPVERTLTTDLLENAAENARIYACPIPGEPLTVAGECIFVIEGYADGKRQRSVEGSLTVKPARYVEIGGEPVDPTPTQAEQLQTQIESIMQDISDAAKAADAKEAAEEAQVAAETACAGAEAALAEATAKAKDASASAAKALSSADAAGKAEVGATAAAAETAEAAAKSEAAADVAAASKTAAVAAANGAAKSQTAAKTAQTAAEEARIGAEEALAEMQKHELKAGESAEASEEYAAEAKSWAIGGTGTREGEDTDNARYWAMHAEQNSTVVAHNADESAHADIREKIDELAGNIPAKVGELENDAGYIADADLDTHNADPEAHKDLAPTYTEATTLEKLTSGEKLKVLLGKIAKAVTDFISHIANKTLHITAEERTAWNGKAAGNHTHTAAQIGAAASSHSHSDYYSATQSRTKNTVLAAPNGAAGAATFRALVPADIPALPASKIGSGTLDVVRGGTGQASLADTVYATPRYRASALVAVETTPTINGAVNWRYE